MTRRVAPLALAGLAGLASLNAWLLAAALEIPAPGPQAKASVAAAGQSPDPSASELDPPEPRPLAAYGQTVAKPVFFKARAPYVPPPPPPPPAPPRPAALPPPADPGLVLGGVVIMDNARKAYIFNKADSRGAWLSEGETILGWKVESIDAMTAKLQQADRSVELELYPRKK
ncbi:MAG TPA: hypothetical protein VH913_11320 [Hyphomicrobiaceae bacterium]|jgi:hypothetical protein